MVAAAPEDSFTFLFAAVSIRLRLQASFLFLLKPRVSDLPLKSAARRFSPLDSALSRLPGPSVECFGVRRGGIISRNASLLPRLRARMRADGAETKPPISARKAR